MSETTSQEPTMEEILASIRRIISEDETPGDGEPDAAGETETEAVADLASPDPEPEPEVEVVAEVAAAPEAPAPLPDREPSPPQATIPELDEDDDLELTQKVETLGDLDVLEADAPPPAPAPVKDVASLVSDQVAAAAAASFGHLSANIGMPPSGHTLEDVVREMLRPLLQQWLDTHLPNIVQEAVQSEVERIARGRVR